MKKLCYGSLLAVLVKCKAHSFTQKKLCGTMLLSIDPHDDRTGDDGFASALVKGRSNLPDTIRDNAPTANPQQIANYFKTKVLPMLDNNKKANIVLALKDIIASDESVRDDTVVELVNQITKERLTQRTHFVYEEFLAGVFLYVCIYPQNAGSSDSINEITDEYIESLDAHTADVVFVADHSKLDGVFAAEIATEAHNISLLTDAGGKCLACGRPLSVNDGGNETDFAQIVNIEGEDIILCVDCARKVRQYSENEKAELVRLKDDLVVQTAIIDAVARHDIERQIEQALREIDQLDETEDTKLKTDPVPVERKIKEKRLLRDILNDVRPLFDGVNTILDRLAGEGVFNNDKFAKNIRRMYEDADTGSLSQTQIFELLVETLNNKTGRKYRTACRIVISYFVQRCEVFNEITE